MNNDIYKTRDLAESAALIISRQHLIRMERQGKICWFIFEDQKECMKISNDYFFGEFMINAREFYEVITRLKNRMFAGT